MLLMIVFTGAFALGLQAQVTSGDSVLSRRTEHELTDRLRWEILWNEAEILVPAKGLATLAIYRTSKSLFYCSRDLGKCAKYRMENNFLGQRMKSMVCTNGVSVCKEGQDDRDLLRAFLHQIDPTLAWPSLESQQIPQVDVWSDNFGTMISVMGTITVHVGSREEIVEHYRQLRPAKLDSLKTHLVSLRSGGYRSITVPCFADSDPEVKVYGERAGTSPVVVWVFWNAEQEEWQGAGTLGLLGQRTIKEQEKIEELREMIESIKCATVEFD